MTGIANRDCSTVEKTAAAESALISDHALMRHQNSRRINTSPAPAPIVIRKRHAPAIDVM